MLFSEPIFLFLFLPVVLLFYALLPQKWRNGWLTLASLIFYAWGELRFVPVMVGSIILNYYIAIWIERTKGSGMAFWLLTFGVVSDLGLLAYFKYAGFFFENLNLALSRVHGSPLSWELGSIVLPLGISFFTFHKISYKVDVFRGHAVAKRNPLDLALYILLFPQLIAGPIVRYNEIAEQLGSHARQLSLQRFSTGISIFIIGLAKKMLIANTVASPADHIFSLPVDQLTPALAWLGVVCYTLQIYFDFSGYSDMAIGLACMFGFDFPANFRYPYIADSVTDFWRRWHMSLSRWFRDYVYIPLGGNRVSTPRLYANLLTVFFLCGLWHGAARTFVFWGLYHGFFLVLERTVWGKMLAHLPRLLRHAYLLLVIMVGWVFFRADSLHHAGHYLYAMSGIRSAQNSVYYPALYLNSPVWVAIFAGLLGSTPWLPVTYRALRRRFAEGKTTTASVQFYQAAHFVRLAGLVLYLFLSVLAVVAGTYNPFIYFRF